MALKQTITQLKDYLAQITQDLEKADGGNKAASQRVRTGTIRFEKLAKTFRKESIKDEKTNKGKKRPVKKAAGKTPVKAQAKPVKKTAKPAPAKKGAVAKKTTKKATAGSRAFSVKRTQTAKLPSKRRSSR